MAKAEVKTDSWIKAMAHPSTDAHFHISWAKTAMIAQALEDGRVVYEFMTSQSLKEGDTFDKFEERFRQTFPNLTLFLTDRVPGKSGAGRDNSYYNRLSAVAFDFISDHQISLQAYSRDESFMKALAAFVDENTSKTIPKGRVHVMVATQEGPEFRSIGAGGAMLERDNYSDAVLKGYDRIVKDLNSEHPEGRLAILDGAPGTGKTYLVRGLLEEIKDATIIIIPSNLVADMAQPGTVPALVRLHEERGGRPMVFIIEDADECLAPRDEQNMSAVSAVLNLGDGILGSLLDVRIVATTNAYRQDLDKAIMRPGRLSAAVAVGALPMDKAQAIYRRLAPGKSLPAQSQGYTLAEIYSHARDTGWEPAKQSAPIRIGF